MRLVEVAVLDPGQAAFSHQLVELMLHVDLARRQRGNDCRDITHADHAEDPAVLDHGEVPDPAFGHLPGGVLEPSRDGL